MGDPCKKSGSPILLVTTLTKCKSRNILILGNLIRKCSSVASVAIKKLSLNIATLVRSYLPLFLPGGKIKEKGVAILATLATLATLGP